MIVALLALVLTLDDPSVGLPPPPVPAPAPAPASPPYWERLPTVEDMTRVYPAEAKARGAGGRATLDCAIAPSGQMTDCRVAQESPGDLGFGAAALSVASLIVLGEETRSSPPFAGGRALIPIIWRTEDCPALLPPAVGDSSPKTLSIASWSARFDLISRPRWLTKPSGDDLRKLFPRTALRNGISGRATMVCVVTVEGRMGNCRTDSETPEGMGFGEATLKLAPRFRMTTMTDDCVGVDGATIIIPVAWTAPE